MSYKGERLSVFFWKKHLDPVLKIAYPLVVSNETVFHKDLANLIIDDAISPKTFENIKDSIMRSRLNHYSLKKALYHTMFDQNNMLVTCTPFSSFDNKEGYNEIGAPDVQLIVNFFIIYIKSKDKYFTPCLESIQIHRVISIDGTFYIQKKTKVNIIHN